MQMQQLILAVAVIAGLIYIGLCLRFLQPDQVGVKVRYGRPGRRVGPGPQWAWWPIERIDTETIELERITADEAEYVDGQGGTWKIRPYVVVGMDADNPRPVLYKSKGRKRAFAFLKAALTVPPTNLLGGWNTNDLRTADARTRAKEAFEAETRRFADALGLDVTEYGLADFDATGDTRSAIEKEFQAGQEHRRLVELAKAEADVTRIERAAQQGDWLEKSEQDAMVAAAEKGAVVIFRGGGSRTRTSGGGDDDDVQTGLLARVVELLSKSGKGGTS